MTFWIDKVRDESGMIYWVLFTHGQFHKPVALIGDTDMRTIAERVLGRQNKITELSTAIKRYRKANKMTQQEFADCVGLSRNRIAQIEGGKANNLTTETLDRIQSVIGGSE